MELNRTRTISGGPPFSVFRATESVPFERDTFAWGSAGEPAPSGFARQSRDRQAMAAARLPMDPVRFDLMSIREHEEATNPSDLYAMSRAIYEMRPYKTRPVFPGLVREAHCQKTSTPLHLLLPNAPLDLIEMVMAGLEKDPR